MDSILYSWKKNGKYPVSLKPLYKPHCCADPKFVKCIQVDRVLPKELGVHNLTSPKHKLLVIHLYHVYYICGYFKCIVTSILDRKITLKSF